MSDEDLLRLMERTDASPLRIRMAKWIESKKMQFLLIAVILLNSAILGLETSSVVMERFGTGLLLVDKICLAIFVGELLVKFFAYRFSFWKSGWNVFDFLVVAVALTPGAGAWSVLRSLRVLRVLRLLTMIPSLRKVVAAFIHSVPGLLGLIAVMAIFFYTAGVLATVLFGVTHPDWFGSLGKSLFTLFQIMTLESWSMGIVRPVMEAHPWAWGFFVPFIMVATFTILNLFIGIIVSTMQELSMLPEDDSANPELLELLERIDTDMKELRAQLEKSKK